MAYEVEWKVTQNNADTVYESVEAFFVTTDAALIKQHIDIEENRVITKENQLSDDGKSFQHFKLFEDKVAYDEWSELKATLPAIDEHLTYTLV